jgi:ABC-type polysaccharide/polyol phosphate export permease
MAATSISEQELHLVAPRQPVSAHLRDIWRFRELLRNLVRKELKVKYKNSALGFVWSMLNPLFLLAVYGVAFNILGTAFDYFTIWLLIGILVWNLFATAVMASTSSITANGYLVNKVRFPREVLPLASVGAALVHFFLQSTVLIAVLAVVRYNVDWTYMWLVPIALVTLLVFAAGLGILFSAMNVYLRDTGHLLELWMMAWFWLSPILYGYMLVADKLLSAGVNANLLLLNPVTAPLISFQRALYGKATIVDTKLDPATGKTVVVSTTHLLPDASVMWYLRNLAVVLFASTLLLLLAIKIFDKAEGNFAEVM